MAHSNRKSLAAPNTRRSPRLVRGRRGPSLEAPRRRSIGGADAREALDVRQVQKFMNMTQQAMELLMREHGFSPQRAQRTLLDHLVPGGASSISDTEIFDSMRLHHIGMEQATIALTVEKAIMSLVNAPQSTSPSSINRVLDGWTASLKHVKPMPLREAPIHSEISAIVLPKIPTSSAATVPPPDSKSLISLTTTAPATPAPAPSVAKEKAAPPTSRSKASKKSSKPPASTPPTTITTTQRSRSGSMLEAVSSKLTGGVDTDGALKGRPPLAPGTLGTTSSAAASNKRANTMVGDVLVERPSTPPSSTSNKRQRRSSGAN